MLIIKIKSGDSLDKALKMFKSKVIKTKQNQNLFKKKEFIKKSVIKRKQILKAIYKEKMRNI